MIIIGIEDNEVAFLTDLDAADAVRTVQGGCTVQSKGGDGFFNAHIHVNACQGKSQRNGAGEATAGD